MIKILSVVGARPNFMKVAPLHRAFKATGKIESIICHTGQHYDARMSDIFFRQLELPEPHIYLGIQGGSHAEQTGRIMMAFEKVIDDHQPDVVLVVGDVNSTLACSITAVKLHIPTVHVEAGLRSFDRRMPEEINRLVTDAIVDHLFVTEQSGLDHLQNEGVAAEKVHFTGNVMIDSLVHFKAKAEAENTWQKMDLEPKSYLLSTIHRPSNVDRKEDLEVILSIWEELSLNRPIVLPLHPRTENSLQKHGLRERFEAIKNLKVIEPQGYLSFLNLIMHAEALVTDSGGIQEETTFLGVPCITLRENTERPSTIEMGTNELVKIDPQSVKEALPRVKQKSGQVPPLWDGKAAERIAAKLIELYS